MVASDFFALSELVAREIFLLYQLGRSIDMLDFQLACAGAKMAENKALLTYVWRACLITLKNFETFLSALHKVAVSVSCYHYLSSNGSKAGGPSIEFVF